MNPLLTLNSLGQSVWYDNIQRSMLSSGMLQKLVEEDGLKGVTSNPAIFEKAINGSSDYDSALATLRTQHPDWTSRELFFELAVEDIKAAADVLRPVYDGSNGKDGMISLEVGPDLAHDADGTIAEGRELWQRVDRPNLMIKVPATREGLVAIQQLIADGINVNVTLLFSTQRHEEVMDAYLAGLEARLKAGKPIDKVASVASFFISRVDAAIDKMLGETKASGDQVVAKKVQSLMGKIAIANAKVSYQNYKDMFGSERFHALREAGAQTQRLLWASTGTKNPDYSDVLYVETLIGADTVNTMPPATFDAFRSHGHPHLTLEHGVDLARHQVSMLSEVNVDLDAVTDELEAQGVASFASAFDTLLGAIDSKLASENFKNAASA